MPAPADNRALEALRMRRAELRESKSALEQALAAPAARTAGSLDAARPCCPCRTLQRPFGNDVAIAKGPHGIYRGVLSTTPRPTGEVARLTRDHVEIKDLIDQR